MADIGKGYDFVPGEQVTDVKLDNLAEASIILPAFVTAKSELLVPSGTEFFNVVDSTGTFKKVSLGNIPGAATQPNPTYSVLTGAAGVFTQVCVLNKVYQNAKLTLGAGANSLVISGATNGMFGCIIVAQSAGGNSTLALPATSWNLGQNGSQALADITLQAGTGTICSWTYDGVFFYWTFAKYVAASPYCRCYMTSQSLANATMTSILYNSENFDNDTVHSNSTNPDRVTVQRPGVYLATVWLAWVSNPTGQRYGAIGYNGAVIAADRRSAIQVSDQCVTTVYYAVAGDYFHVMAYQDCGGPIAVANSTFNVVRVGAL